MVYPCDISKKSEVVKMGVEILEKFGHIDILINNAGFGIFNKIQHQSIEEIESVLFTNYLGMILLYKIFFGFNDYKKKRTYH